MLNVVRKTLFTNLSTLSLLTSDTHDREIFVYLLSDYDYTLPEALIAQVPVRQRHQSRLMLLERDGRRISHHAFEDIVRLLHPGDLLVVNNTRVIPGRLIGTKETGGRVEVLLLHYPGDIREEKGLTCPRAAGSQPLEPRAAQGAENGEALPSTRAGELVFNCLAKASKPPRVGSKIHFPGGLRATVLGAADGVYDLAFEFSGDFDDLLDDIGQVPLPPYIKRNGQAPPACDDQQAYQTVYAEKSGAVAAPTAGLHFSRQLLDQLKDRGIEVVAITLHVGYGTFLPVRVTDIRQHKIHPETYELTDAAASAVNEAKDAGRRIIAVGTTAVRVLEYAADTTGAVRPGSGRCDLFIYPGFQYKVIHGLITNFHLPKSTLLMLVSAFAGRQFILDAYEEAIRRKYRFYSYGDAMLIR
jgi:S-adenosylmethionine:tRNA ribosyltransferase-isomerase